MTIPDTLNRLTRNVILNHPRSWECQLFRKQLMRQSDSSMGGLPTLGGLGVLDAEDEEALTYAHLGNGYALAAEAFTPATMVDRLDTHNGSGDECRFLIEPEEPSGFPGYFVIRKSDVLYIVLSESVKMAYEIVAIETLVNIAPFVTRYVCNRRGELDCLP
ncbi:hypothetical protein HZU77_007020 [Neisseriaceae bacterium TC5R-5]|nr:hypothetical protein [Neisseriaceae bacterium TC5R-5]